MSIESLDIRAIVRRVSGGAAPFAWEIVGAKSCPPLSPARFRSMEAAYRAGQEQLAEFLANQHAPRRGRPAAAPAIDCQVDEADAPRDARQHGEPGEPPEGD